MVKTKKVEGYC